MVRQIERENTMTPKQAKHYAKWLKTMQAIGGSIRTEPHSTGREVTFRKADLKKSLTMVFDICEDGKVTNLWFDIYDQNGGFLIKHSKFAASKVADLFADKLQAIEASA